MMNAFAVGTFGLECKERSGMKYSGTIEWVCVGVWTYLSCELLYKAGIWTVLPILLREQELCMGE